MVTNTIELRDLRRLYDIRDLLHLGSNKKLIVCPLPQHYHHHGTASFSIYYTKLWLPEVSLPRQLWQGW